jgi:hypothetical protein
VAGIVNGMRQLPCYATFKPGPKVCPYCGLPIFTQPRKVSVVEGELQQVQGPMVAANNGRIMRALYESLYQDHKRRWKPGYKPNYARTAAAHVFKKKYGIFPPREWTA